MAQMGEAFMTWDIYGSNGWDSYGLALLNSFLIAKVMFL